MKKNFKILIGVIVGVVILYGITFLIDYYRCSNLQEPIFVIAKQENDLTRKKITYLGLGYKVEVEKEVTQEYGNQIIKVEMYMFNQLITGSVSEVSHNNSQLEENKTSQFRGIVKRSSVQFIEVEPIEEKDQKILSDRVTIGLKDNTDMLYMEGTEVFITYTGEVMESYPTQINALEIQTETMYTTKIEELPEKYDLTKAIADHCVIATNNNKMYNKDELDRFIENVKNNIPDFIRCISFTTEGDMLITDVNFEGSNSFRVCFDWTRDKWSGKEDRTYHYSRYQTFSAEPFEEGVGYYVSDPIEGDLGKMYITGYRNDTEIVNDDASEDI